MPQKSVNTRSTHSTGAGIVTAITITTPPSQGRISLHDCASPDQAAAHNEVWPRGNNRNTISYTKGLVVHCTDPSVGVVNVTTVP